MTLHQAIQTVLEAEGREMSATELTHLINREKLLPLPVSVEAVTERVSQCPYSFQTTVHRVAFRHRTGGLKPRAN